MAIDDIRKALNDGREEGPSPVADEPDAHQVSHGSDTELREEVNRTSRQSGYGELSSTATRSFLGLNHRGFGNPIPMNKEQFGLTFFTRPRLNLSYDNIAKIRKMTAMATNDELSVPRAVRAWLDHVGEIRQTQSHRSLLSDPNNPFLSVLTNNLISISGWPDPTLPTYTSNAGLKKEEYSMVDGVYRIFNTFDITATFKNIASDPITMLFDVWCEYAALVYEGVFQPYREAIINNRVDYMTRIYRITLDEHRDRVMKIAACGAAFPKAISMGAHFNYAADAPYNVDNDQISVPFTCIGVDYLDPITIEEFNTIVQIFNNQMRPNESGVRSNMVKLERVHKSIPGFNYHGYPQINPETMEFEIWVTRETFDSVLGGVSI